MLTAIANSTGESKSMVSSRESSGVGEGVEYAQDSLTLNRFVSLTTLVRLQRVGSEQYVLGSQHNKRLRE